MKKLLMTLAAAASACALFADCGGEDGSQTCTYYDGERVWSLDRSTTWVSDEQIDYWSVKGVNPAPEGTLEIPYRLGDFNVIGISGGAFANATNLTTVVVGDGVLYIDADAFANCEKLDDITLPSGMAWIHCDAFRGTKAEEKNADKGFQIGEYFIKYTGDKSKFSIPDNVKMICDYAFYYYATNSTGEYALKEVEIPEGVETIGTGAFKPIDDACALEKIELPDSVTAVGYGAFAVGESLKTLKLGAGITDISFINNWITVPPAEVLPVQYEDLLVDMFEDAELVDDECGQVFGDNSEATCQDGEPYSVEHPGRRSLWFCWTAPRSGLVSMEIVDGDFDTVLGVYQGADVADLIEVAYDDDGSDRGNLSKLAFDAIEGEEYFIYVAGYSEGSYGWFELDWSYEKSAVAANWVEKLILGNGVVEIPEETFYGTGWNCLNTVEFGEALTCIGSCAFADCTTLSNVNFKTAVNLSGMGVGAFAESAVTEVDLSECTQLAELPYAAFGWCQNLEKVVFNEGLESIGSACFAGCEKLEKVEFPESLKSIGHSNDGGETGAFEDCEALKTVTFNEGLEEIGIGSFRACVALEKLEFPASLKIIGPYAFGRCEALSKVDFNEGLETIGDNAFAGYNAIDKLEFPASLATIGEEAFLNCTNVTKVTFAEESVLEELGKWAFENLVKLEKIEIPASVTTIDGYLFDGCEKLEKVEGGDGVIACFGDMFGDCPFARFGEFDEEGKELKDEIVTFGKVVIGLRGKCPKSIDAEDFGEEIVQIAPDVFSWSSNNSVSNLTSVTFPETLEVIGARAFCGAANLKDVVFGENTEALDIGDEAFRATGIKDLEGTFHQIGSSAFRDCTDLKTVSVTVQATKLTDEDGEYSSGGFVNSSAFAGCTNLVSADVSALGVEIADSCETGVSGGRIYSSVFSSCTALAEARLVADGGLYSSVFNSCGTNALKKLEIDVDSIPSNLAKDQKALDTLVLGDRVKWIGSSAFQGCEKLGAVVIPTAVREIGSSAFRGCVKLDAVEIPPEVTTIEASAFEDCVKLGTVTGCENVERVKVAAFENTDFITGAGKGPLQVGCVLFRWIDGKEGETAEIDESVLTLAYGAFTSNTVAKVVVPSGISRVEAGTFVSCSGLQVVEFANPDVLLSTGAAVDCVPQPQWVATKGGFIFKGFAQSSSYGYLCAQFEKVRFHNDPNEDGAFVAGSTYVGWIMREGSVVGSITVKTAKPDAKGQSKVTATVQLPGSKKAYTSLFEVDPETGKAKSVDGFYSDLYGMILGGKWMSGTVNFAGARYTVRGGSDVSNTAAFDSYVGHVWAAALKSEGEGSDDDCYTALCNGFSSIVVTPAKKGKIKVTGLLADGTKVSTTAQMVAGDHGMVAVPVSLQLYQGKKGGFSFLLQFYMDNGKPKMYFDDDSADGSIGTWYYQLPDHWKPFADVDVWVKSVGEIDVNGAGFKTSKAYVYLDGETESSYEALRRATKGKLVDAYNYEECEPCFSVDSVDVAVDAAKGKWTLPKAGKLSLLAKPEAYAAFIADKDNWEGNFAPDGKYLQPYLWSDGSDTPTCCDLDTWTPTHWLVYDLGSKLDKKSNQVTLGANTNEGAWKLSYAKKSGQFSGSMQYYWVDTSNAEKHALKKGKATVGGVVIDGVAYGTAAIKGVCSYPVWGEDVETE